MFCFKKKVNNLNAIPKDDEGNALFVYKKEVEWVNEKENYKYNMEGNPLFLPEEIENKPVPVGSTFKSWFTGAMWKYTNAGWRKVAGSDPEIVELETPIDELIANTSIDYTLTNTGEFEEVKLNDRIYKFPIYTAENADAIYEHDAHNANVQISLKNDAAGYTFKKVVDGEEIEDLSFDADLTDRVDVLLQQVGIEEGDTDLKYAIILAIHTTATPDPTPTIESGSLISDEETPTIADFTIDAGIIKIDPQSAVDAYWRVNGITFSPVWDNVKLYLGEYNVETSQFDYRPYVPNETISQENDMYRFMPIYNGAEPSEDEFNFYPIEFITSNKKGGKR